MLRPALLLSTALLSIAAPTAAGQADFGDAPTGAGVYLSAPAVAGAFPVAAAVNGPRHAAQALRLGPTATAEGAPRQPDRDRDDGVSVDVLRRCGASRISVLIDARRLRPATRTGDVVVNAWMDFNRDGDWGDVGCADEWVVANHAVPMSALGADGVALVPLLIRGGEQVDELAIRVTITHGQPVVARNGAGGTLADGETEDLIRRPGNGRAAVARTSRRRAARAIVAPGASAAGRGGAFSVTCDPNPAIVEHGRRMTIAFRVFDSDPTAGPIDAEISPNNLFSGRWKATPLPLPNQRGAPRGKFLSLSFRFQSRKRHTVAANLVIETVRVKWDLRRAGRFQRLTCEVQVVHEQRLPPRRPEPAKVDPPRNDPPAPGGGVPVPPPDCTLALTGDNGPNGPPVDHIKLTAVCSNRPIGKITITAPAGKTFVPAACAATRGTMVGCTNDGATSISTWNAPAGTGIEYLAQVDPPPPSGAYRVVVTDEAGTVVTDQTLTVP